jgi:PST family polysaccharide transporter
MSSIEKIAFKGASWLALFKFTSQLFSWGITVLIARILVPDDYGLMAMATMITGYAALFSELGLGDAIIQKPKIKQSELSSVFWFAMNIAFLLTIMCFFSSYLMAYIFDEPRIIPLIKTISIIFIINGLQIVPFSLLKKNLDFKKVGLIEMAGVFISCCCMITIAYLGGGVWTLVGGNVILSLAKLIFVSSYVEWLPQLHFNFKEAKSYITFGITVTISYSFFYLFDISDKFFAGRAWTPLVLGYYAFALQLSQIPTEKIVVLINQVSFPAFSELQHDQQKFNNFYLNVTKIMATLVIPLFVGGYLLGEDLIKFLLNEKWFPIIFLFRYLCLAQIFTALSAANTMVHNAQGRPYWGLWYNAARAIIMATSFYFAVQYGLNAMLIPWFTTYVILCAVWIIITLHKIGIDSFTYLKTLAAPLMATFCVVIGLKFYNYVTILLPDQSINALCNLTLEIVIGALCYISYLWLFDRKLFYSLAKLRE